MTEREFQTALRKLLSTHAPDRKSADKAFTSIVEKVVAENFGDQDRFVMMQRLRMEAIPFRGEVDFDYLTKLALNMTTIGEFFRRFEESAKKASTRGKAAKAKSGSTKKKRKSK